MKVGDTVWYTIPRNQQIYEGTIVKIGSKLIHVAKYDNDRNPFRVSKETLRDKSDYGWNYRCQVYLNKQDILDEREYFDLWQRFQIFFNKSANKRNISLELLRHIANHLGIRNDEANRELKPCPFCGSILSEPVYCHVKKLEEPKYLAFKVVCPICGAEHKYEWDTKEQAKEYWNKRYEPPTPGGAIVPAGNKRLKGVKK